MSVANPTALQTNGTLYQVETGRAGCVIIGIERKRSAYSVGHALGATQNRSKQAGRRKSKRCRMPAVWPPAATTKTTPRLALSSSSGGNRGAFRPLSGTHRQDANKVPCRDVQQKRPVSDGPFLLRDVHQCVTLSSRIRHGLRLRDRYPRKRRSRCRYRRR